MLSISGDGGLGQYLADFTTAVKYRFPLTHIVLNNGELAKISREQLGAIRPVWETNLVNPDFCEYARLCGGAGFSVRRPEELRPALEAALAIPTGRRWSRSIPPRRTSDAMAMSEARNARVEADRRLARQYSVRVLEPLAAGGRRR